MTITKDIIWKYTIYEHWQNYNKFIFYTYWIVTDVDEELQEINIDDWFWSDLLENVYVDTEAEIIAITKEKNNKVIENIKNHAQKTSNANKLILF